MSGEQQERRFVPRHIAVIMDGNGRWARKRGLPRLAGHRAGTENIRRIVTECAEQGVRYLTLYAFSTENWSRPSREVNGLMQILGEFIDRETLNLHKQGAQIRHLGRMDNVSEILRRKIHEAVSLTHANDRITVAVAFNYGGRADIVDAVRALVAQGIAPDAIDEHAIAEHLSTRGMPDPDLIIRTGGEWRLSNFLIWQAAYSEYWSTPDFWPDFGLNHLRQAIHDYGQRERRFGGIPQKWDSLAQRLVSALALIPLIIALVWWNFWALVVVVIAVMVVALLELYGAFARGGFQPRVGLGLAIVVGLALAVTLEQIGQGDFLPLVLTLAIVASLVFELSRHSHEGALPSWALTLAGALYIAWLFSHLIMLRALDTRLEPVWLARLGLQPGAAWIYLVLAITWLQDTVAYFVGRAWGHHRMAPVLSPKKTWEGAIGGLIAAIGGGVAAVLVFGLPISPFSGALLGLVGGIVGPLGDLAESLIKRQVGLKDAGHLIPGHGGILDRADSLLFIAPVLFYLIVFLTG